MLGKEVKIRIVKDKKFFGGVSHALTIARSSSVSEEAAWGWQFDLVLRGLEGAVRAST